MTATAFLTPQQTRVVGVVSETLHGTRCPQGEPCPAADTHTDEAVEVLHALESRGYLDLEDIDDTSGVYPS